MGSVPGGREGAGVPLSEFPRRRVRANPVCWSRRPTDSETHAPVAKRLLRIAPRMSARQRGPEGYDAPIPSQSVVPRSFDRSRQSLAHLSNRRLLEPAGRLPRVRPSLSRSKASFQTREPMKRESAPRRSRTERRIGRPAAPPRGFWRRMNSGRSSRHPTDHELTGAPHSGRPAKPAEAKVVLPVERVDWMACRSLTGEQACQKDRERNCEDQPS